MRKLLTLFLITTMVLLALPFVAKFGVLHYLKQHAQTAKIESISVNLFTGKIGLKNLRFSANDQSLRLAHVQINISWLKLVKQQLLIESLELSGLESSITQAPEGWIIGGILLPTIASEPTKPNPTQGDNQWGFGIESLQFDQLAVKIDSEFYRGDIRLEQLKLRSLYSWQTNVATHYDLTLTMNGAPVIINGTAHPFTSPIVIDSNINITDVPLSPFAPLLKTYIEDGEGLFNSNINLQLNLGANNSTAALKGEVGFSKLQAQLGAYFFKTNTITWRGQQTFSLSDQTQAVVISGKLDADELLWRDDSKKIAAKEALFRFTGDINVVLAQDQEATISGLAALDLGAFSLSAIEKNLTLLSFESLHLQNISASNNHYRIADSTLANMALLYKKDQPNSVPLLKTPRILVSDVDFLEQLVIDKIELDELRSQVRLNAQGQIELIEEAKKLFTSNDDLVPIEHSPPSKPLLTHIRALNINNAALDFFDHSVTPTFHSTVHALNAHIDNIDQTKHNSESKLTLAAKLGTYSEITLGGTLQPFASEQNAAISVNIDQFELVPLSPYSSQSAGIQIQQGTLDVATTIKVVRNQLDIDNNIYFRQLNIEDTDVKTQNALLASLPMPLDLMLDVLRDKENTIHLNIPVQGSIDDPQFSLQDIYNKAIAKALKFAATRYLTQAVQPLGLVLSAGDFISKGMAPRFEALIYEPATSALSLENQKHLEKIAVLLKERKQLRISLCAVSAETDWLMLPEVDKQIFADQDGDQKTNTLLALADLRATKAKTFFVEQQQIEPARIFICHSKIQKTPNEQAELRISL